MNTNVEHETGDLWVFGYGSLMWRPGFAYLERVPARLIGLAPGALRLFLRSSRHAGAAGPGARARSRRHVPRHRLSRRRRGACRNHRLFARARTGHPVYLETMRRIELEDHARRGCARCATSSTAAMRNMPGG